MGYVYLIACGELHKIGIASDIAKRIAQMQTGNPVQLTLVGYMKCGTPALVETSLHKAYESKRASGEWFRLDRADVAEILAQFTAETTDATPVSVKSNQIYTQDKRFTVAMLDSAVKYCQLAGIRIQYANKDGRLVLALDGVNLVQDGNVAKLVEVLA